MLKTELAKANASGSPGLKRDIGYSARQKGTIKALGLRRLGDVVEHDNTPTVWGMAQKVEHLVLVEAAD